MTKRYGLPSTTTLAAMKTVRVLWIGQSNAQTQCTSYTEATKWAGPWNAPKIWAYRRSSYLGSDLTEEWRAMAARQAGVTNGATGLPGADLVAARTLMRESSIRWEHIEFTQGSTSLYTDWAKTEGTCYVRMTGEWNTAVGSHPSPPSSPIPVIVWIQGESDAQNATMANAYGTNLPAFFSDLRTDVPALETAHLIIPKLHPNCTLGGGIGGARNATIRSAQDAYAAANPTLVTTVEVSDLALEADSLHYSQASQIALGQRIASTIAGIV